MRLAGLFLLEKGSEERVAPVPTRDAIPALVSQVFRPVPRELRTPEILQRVGKVPDLGIRQLTFRKHPDVGPFMARWAGVRQVELSR